MTTYTFEHKSLTLLTFTWLISNFSSIIKSTVGELCNYYILNADEVFIHEKFQNKKLHFFHFSQLLWCMYINMHQCKQNTSTASLAKPKICNYFKSLIANDSQHSREYRAHWPFWNLYIMFIWITQYIITLHRH